jgi:UDP-glucose 4-epimerase
MKILITGVAGLLGSRLADWIVDNTDHKVIGIDDLSGGYKENINSKVEFINLDVCSNKLESIFVKHKPDYVFHFAAYAAEGLSPFIRKYNYQNNLLATANIVNCCVKYNTTRLIFTSTMAVYGEGTPPFDESHQPAPIDPYGVAKYACEMDIQIAGEQHGLDWCIIRPHNVYGVKQNIWDKYRNVLGIWMYQYLNNEPMTIFGDGKQTRAFSFIDDCLEPLWNAAVKKEASKEIINLGSSVFTSIKDANKILREVIGDGDVVNKEQRHEVKHAHPTWTKSVKILEYKEVTDLRTGLEKMWKWAKEQPNRNRFVWDTYEIEKGIYNYWKQKK